MVTQRLFFDIFSEKDKYFNAIEKKLFLKISQNAQENTFTRVSFAELRSASLFKK